MRTWLWTCVVLMSCASRAGGADEKKPAQTAPLVVEKRAPSAAATAFQTSYDEEAAGRVEAALAALDPLPSPARESYVAELRRGWLLSKLGKHAESAAAYARATATEPASVEPRLGALVPLSALRRWTDVETISRQVLERDPSSYTASLRLAFALYSLGRYPEAETQYRRLSSLYPSDVDVRSGVGWSLLKMGKTADAAKAFEGALDIAPKHALSSDGLRAARSTK